MLNRPTGLASAESNTSPDSVATVENPIKRWSGGLAPDPLWLQH
jgi:hypothetical protein